MLSYRVILDVPLPLVLVGVPAAGRSPPGDRHPERDACPDLLEAGGLRAGLVPGPAGHPRVGQGFGISQATAYRYKDEAVEVLAAEAPTLREALEKALSRGFPT